MEAEKEKPEIVWKAEKLVAATMGGRDASHDAAHAFRVRGLALSLAKEEALSGPSLEIVELAALLHDIGDYKYAKWVADCIVHNNSQICNFGVLFILFKYCRDFTEDTTTVEKFLEEERLEESKREMILAIIRHMGFKNEVASTSSPDSSLEFCIVQDADRLDAIGAIGIARCFTYGGSKNHILYDPEIPPRQGLTKEKYMMKDGKQTTVNHFHEKLFKLKDLMKTKAGKNRAEKRHKFMEDFLVEFFEEWSGRS
ncbi:hypothetical protein C4D60_Mb02t00680 [Musa balbisiana]|uniref:HD/PDEase domain-containing protein n=1 Tax=Musa balbisiana TaxID=52838 RepID=A0A4S8I797_MUSBA|nr:hypothetical protein C4D60_Mb02t00680 [Musa balbisiana]